MVAVARTCVVGRSVRCRRAVATSYVSEETTIKYIYSLSYLSDVQHHEQRRTRDLARPARFSSCAPGAGCPRGWPAEAKREASGYWVLRRAWAKVASRSQVDLQVDARWA